MTSAGFGVGVDTGSSPTFIPAGAPGAASLPLAQIISDLIDHQRGEAEHSRFHKANACGGSFSVKRQFFEVF